MRAGVFELKIYYGNGARVYYTKSKDNILILLYGGSDKKQQTEGIKKAIAIKERLRGANMKNGKKIEGVNLSDAKIVKTDLFEEYAEHLRNNPKELKEYRQHIVEKYNEAQDIVLLLESLKILAMAEGKISMLAQKAKIERSSVYRMLSKNANPSFNSIVIFAHNLGIDFQLKAA